MAELTVKGFKELEQKLRALPAKVGTKAAKQGLRAGAKVIQAATKANARSMVGGSMGKLIAKAAVVRAGRKRGSVYSFQVGMDPKLTDQLVHITADGTRHYIPNAIEYGHAFPGRGAKKGAPKDFPANPFARSAFESHKMRALETTKRELATRVERVAAESA